MNIRTIIMNLSDRIADEHAQRVLFDLELESTETFARVGGMGFTIDVLKRINGIKTNWYSFQGLRDRVIFICLYPLSVSFCYALNDVRKMKRFIKNCL